MRSLFTLPSDLLKYNPNHDERGRFSSGPGGVNRGGSKAKLWWQASFGSRFGRRVAGALGRKGYTQKQAANYLRERVIAEGRYPIPNRISGPFDRWYRRAIEYVPPYVFLDAALKAPIMPNMQPRRGGRPAKRL